MRCAALMQRLHPDMWEKENEADYTGSREEEKGKVGTKVETRGSMHTRVATVSQCAGEK